MCTVSFLPTRRGFLLAMNRDELKSRPQGLAPRPRKAGSRLCLYPSEPSGGSWTGVNEAGLALALINWYEKPQRDRSLCISRGIVVPHLLAFADLTRIDAGIVELPLSRINPFRLIAISFRESAIREWRWDGAVLTSKRRGWKRRHWFSSGLDEALANRKRAAVTKEAAEAASAETPAWLRRLHRSHRAERGVFSICMHRDDAETVSYTEIAATARGAEMRHASGAPCTAKRGQPRLLSFAGEAGMNQPR